MDTTTIETLRHLLSTEKRAVLATSGRDGPHASLMAFIAIDGGRRIAFATLRKTRKYMNLVEDERASMLFDNRSRVEGSSRDVVAATATGEARECANSERQQLHDLLIERHPRFQGFIDEPDSAIVVLDVEQYHVVGQFQTAGEMQSTVEGRELTDR